MWHSDIQQEAALELRAYSVEDGRHTGGRRHSTDHVAQALYRARLRTQQLVYTSLKKKGGNSYKKRELARRQDQQSMVEKLAIWMIKVKILFLHYQLSFLT